MTLEQEKALHDALDRLAGELPTLKIMLWRLRAQARIFARWPLEPIDHGKANAIRSALRIGRQQSTSSSGRGVQAIFCRRRRRRMAD